MIKRSTAVLATLAVVVLPGGSLIVGAVWLYRYVRLRGKPAVSPLALGGIAKGAA